MNKDVDCIIEEYESFNINLFRYGNPKRNTDDIFVAPIVSKKRLLFRTPQMEIFSDKEETSRSVNFNLKSKIE